RRRQIEIEHAAHLMTGAGDHAGILGADHRVAAVAVQSGAAVRRADASDRAHDVFAHQRAVGEAGGGGRVFQGGYLMRGRLWNCLQVAACCAAHHTDIGTAYSPAPKATYSRPVYNTM